MPVKSVLLIAAIAGAAVGSNAQVRAQRFFEFRSNDFWLNLHHYLYVIGRAHNRAPDATQPAVASAPDDERQGVAALTNEERQTWQDAVASYANGLSRQTSFFQGPLVPLTLGLASTGDIPDFPAATVDPAVRATLERAAPIYGKGWWPQHRRMNEQYVAGLLAAIDRDGPAITAFLTRVYGLTWPERPYPAHVVAYSNFQGAFSYTGKFIVLSSNANSANERWYPLESVYHEALHQWDDQVAALLRAQATARGVSVPPDLSHILLFVAAGDAVRRRHPEHVPMMDALALWRLGLSGSRVPAERMRAAISKIWMPYLDGRGTRDDTFGAMVEAAAAATPSAIAPRH